MFMKNISSKERTIQYCAATVQPPAEGNCCTAGPVESIISRELTLPIRGVDALSWSICSLKSTIAWLELQQLWKYGKTSFPLLSCSFLLLFYQLHLLGKVWLLISWSSSETQVHFKRERRSVSHNTFILLDFPHCFLQLLYCWLYFKYGPFH